MKRMFSQSPILNKKLNLLLIYSIPKLVDPVDLASMASQEPETQIAPDGTGADHQNRPRGQLTSRTHRRPRSHDVGVRWIARGTVTGIFERA